MTTQEAKRYKVILVGDSNVGKSTYVNYLLTNKFTEEYSQTFGADVYPYVFNSNYGPIIFEFWDCAGKYENRGIDSGYYISANGAIIMYNDESAPYCSEFEEKVRSVCDDIPTILCKNSSNIDTDSTLPNCSIDIKNKVNIYKPIVLLAKKLTGYDDLEIIN